MTPLLVSISQSIFPPLKLSSSLERKTNHQITTDMPEAVSDPVNHIICIMPTDINQFGCTEDHFLCPCYHQCNDFPSITVFQEPPQCPSIPNLIAVANSLSSCSCWSQATSSQPLTQSRRQPGHCRQSRHRTQSGRLSVQPFLLGVG